MANYGEGLLTVQLRLLLRLYVQPLLRLTVSNQQRRALRKSTLQTPDLLGHQECWQRSQCFRPDPYEEALPSSSA